MRSIKIALLLPLLTFFGFLTYGACEEPLVKERYGIMNRAAPELSATYWVDGKGEPATPYKLKEYRGKVIYMLFFQDW